MDCGTEMLPDGKNVGDGLTTLQLTIHAELGYSP
jgi:hypothetical protein